MYIKEIELYNFRIYKGKNKINLSPDGDKNIIVISGKNGFGKTTFLMSLVWCLYGKQMEKVDELYQKEIADKGGYGKYIGNSLNRLAKAQDETKFSVSITFKDVKIPEITCDEIKITRSFDTVTSTSDTVEVLIDNYQNELIQDLTSSGKQDGEEIFIRDFILPIEIAKFFFFDAEKVVALADPKSESEQRRLLSKAYTEVLGIKKYEDLKDQLENIQDEYRKKSAKPEVKAELNQVIADIANSSIDIETIENNIQTLSDEKTENTNNSNEIQIKLIQEGSLITLDQLNEFKQEEIILGAKIEGLQIDLKELFDLIPFGLAGEVLMETSNQLKIENNFKNNKHIQDNVNEKTNNILDDLEKEKKDFPAIIPKDIRNFYEEQISKLVKKYFFNEIPELPKNFELLHEFSDSEENELNNLINNLKNTFKDVYTKIYNEYTKAKTTLDLKRRKIRNAEKDSEDEYISNMRHTKDKFDKRNISIEIEIADLNRKDGEFKNQIKTLKQKQEDLRKRIDDSRKYSDKDQKAQEIIRYLKVFIKSFKEEKKKSLEERMLKELNTLLHKKNFINKIVVEISQAGDDVNINLFNSRNEKIDKGSLSMGERQMYASALLKALVDESDIDFPVFIDSPLQKFDKDHAENVIKEFYPNVSKQVVLFPLFHKELSEKEFTLLKPKVSKTFLIHNLKNDASEFKETLPEDFINTYNELYAN